MGKAMMRAMEFAFYVAFVAIGFCACYTFATWLPPLKDSVSSTIASWAQAIGGVAAIAGAYWIGERQAAAVRRSSIELKSMERVEKMTSILAICRAAVMRIELVENIFCVDLQNFSDVREFAEYDDSLIHAMISAIEAIPIHEVGKAEAVICILDIRDQLRFTIKSLEQSRQDKKDAIEENHFDLSQHRNSRAKNLLNHINRIKRNYKMICECFPEIDPTI